jgi:hypothetical protein
VISLQNRHISSAVETQMEFYTIYGLVPCLQNPPFGSLLKKLNQYAPSLPVSLTVVLISNEMRLT